MSGYSPEKPPNIEPTGLKAAFSPIERMPERWRNAFLHTTTITVTISALLGIHHSFKGDVAGTILSFRGLVGSYLLVESCKKPDEPK